MPEQHNSPVLEDDEELGKVEDVFRRATFSWALSTKRMVDSAAALGKTPRVSPTALADIEYARDLLDKLFLPKVARGHSVTISVDDVQESVLGFLKRAATVPLAEPEPKSRNTPFNARLGSHGQVRMLVDGEWKWVDPPKPARDRRVVDLSAPVHSKNGRMQWADIDCPSCPSKASQRCQKDDGGFVEKPHAARDNLAKQAPNT